MILRARYILAAQTAGIENGALRIAGGRIAEVGAKRSVAGGPVTDLGDCVILPGLVNAHTHLELTHLAGRVPPRGDFVGWVGRLVEAMRADGDDPDRVGEAVRRGRDLSLAARVTTVGDITRLPGLPRPVLASGPLRVVSFGEVIAIGRLRQRLQSRLAAAADRAHESPWLRLGISPHSPYTLEPDGLRACVERADHDGLRICMHLAEFAEEAQFTTSLAGPIRGFLKRHRVWDRRIPCPGLSPVGYAEVTGVLRSASLLAHVNYAADEELDRIAAAGAHVAYCPRTHDAFGHQPHRFKEMIDRGINVCIGTDSLASNPSLSVLEELRFLHRRHPELPGGLLLAMGTVHGARALGLADAVGVVAPGMPADLTVVPLDPQGPTDPVENLLESDLSSTATCTAGEWVGSAAPT